MQFDGPASAGRFAPSPSGRLHVGNLRTALVAWLYSKSDDSPFWLRFEDLDTNAVRPEHYATQMEDLKSLGLNWDGEPLYQSRRLDFYRDAIASLRRSSETFECFCSRKDIREAAQAPNGGIQSMGRYPGTCRSLSERKRGEMIAAGRPPAIRLRGTGEAITVVDELHGEVSGGYDDLVVVRNDGTPAYNLVVVLDDAEQGVELVVRADDLLDSTPAHVGLAQLLGLAVPRYAHVPLIVGADNFRLSKQEGSVTLPERLALGESVQQVIGFLAHSIGLTDSAEQLDASELLATFNPGRLNKTAFQLPDGYLNPE